MEASLKKPTPGLVGNHPHQAWKPFSTKLSGRFDIEFVGIEAAEPATPGVLRTIYRLI